MGAVRALVSNGQLHDFHGSGYLGLSRYSDFTVQCVASVRAPFSVRFLSPRDFTDHPHRHHPCIGARLLSRRGRVRASRRVGEITVRRLDREGIWAAGAFVSPHYPAALGYRPARRIGRHAYRSVLNCRAGSQLQEHQSDAMMYRRAVPISFDAACARIGLRSTSALDASESGPIAGLSRIGSKGSCAPSLRLNKPFPENAGKLPSLCWRDLVPAARRAADRLVVACVLAASGDALAACRGARRSAAAAILLNCCMLRDRRASRESYIRAPLFLATDEAQRCQDMN